MVLNSRMIVAARSLVALILLSCLLSACGEAPPEITDTAAATQTEAQFVGSETCATCHTDAYQDWQQSHHYLAMQPMSAATVLGDFNNSSFEHQGITTTFFMENGEYRVRTAGPDGQLQEFPLLHTFGAYPLQQYLAKLPNGKIQALGVAWDSRPAEDDGQHWFHVYGDELIDHTDVLHWTRQSQNWDTMCADCHSTGLVKQYDLANDTFSTRFAEVNVACEACHGPASQHVDWAKGGMPDATDNRLLKTLDDRKDVSWILDPATGNSSRSMPRLTATEITTCASCHSRREKNVSGPAHDAEFLNEHVPSLIDPGLYYADGQQRDEVYVYGSFLQSKMYAAGVTCSDCHNPHSLELKAPGPQVCLQCHAAETFATEEHTLHAADSAGADCVECHMPPSNYMQIDARHDHGMRIPRPWLSETFGTPDACQKCHSDKTSAWATQILTKRGKGPDKLQPHWSETFALALNANSQPSPDQLQQIAMAAETPEIIRATAFSNGLYSMHPEALAMLEEQLQSSNNMLRWGAARGLNYANPATQARLAPALLSDSVKAIRLEALPIMLSLGTDTLSGAQQRALQPVIEEYIAAAEANSERAEAQVNLGNMYRELQRLGLAETAYKTGLRLNPDFIPAYVNLADLYRLQQREADARALLQQGIERQPRQAMLYQLLGLSFVRDGQTEAALRYFRSAADLSPTEARYAITFGLALEAVQKPQEAVAYLESVRSNLANQRDIDTTIAMILSRAQSPAVNQ